MERNKEQGGHAGPWTGRRQDSAIRSFVGCLQLPPRSNVVSEVKEMGSALLPRGFAWGVRTPPRQPWSGGGRGTNKAPNAAA